MTLERTKLENTVFYKFVLNNRVYFRIAPTVWDY